MKHHIVASTITVAAITAAALLIFSLVLAFSTAIQEAQRSEPTLQPAPVIEVQPEATDPLGLLAPINEYRASKGLGPLRATTKLQASAQMKAIDMVEKNYWAHTSPDGTTPWSFFTAAGYDYSTAGENLARCFSSTSGVVDGWINSSTHEEVLTDDYVDAGFAYAVSPVDGCLYVVGHFGARS